MSEITIQLPDGVKVFIPFGRPVTKCKFCNGDILWGENEHGKSLPVHMSDEGEWVCHFSNCRRPKTNEQYHRNKPYKQPDTREEI